MSSSATALRRSSPRPSRRPLAAVSAAALVVGTLSGCGVLTDEGSSGGREIVASFYPLAWVTEQVAGDDWTVTNLTTPGGEPHDLELGIGATADVADATLVVYLDGFQPAVDAAVSSNAEGETLDAAEVVELDDGDPHFWLDPLRMAQLGDAVAERLAALDAENAEAYRSNAEQLTTQLEEIDDAYEEGLSDCRRDTVVVSHDAFGYLARYGVQFEAINGLSPDAEPNPATLAELTDVIEDEGVTTVFSERLASPALAEALASDLDVATGVLDPLEGLTEETADADYPSLMRDNLAALQEANGC